MVLISNIVRKMRWILFIKKNRQYIDIQNASLGGTFSLEFRAPRKYVSFRVGKDSILYNHNIFESETGYISIGDRVFINSNTQLISVNKIEIGNDVLISWGCTIYDHNGHSLDFRERENDHQMHLMNFKLKRNLLLNKNWQVVKSAPIIIEDNVWIGMYVVILKGVTIGTGSVISACAVVTESVPPWSIVAGNPAKVIRTLRRE